MPSTIRGNDNFDSEASSFTVIENANGVALVYNNGWKRQFFRGSITSQANVTFPVPFTGDIDSIFIQAMHTSTATSQGSVANLSGTAISLTQCRFTAFTQSGSHITSGITAQYVAEGF